MDRFIWVVCRMDYMLETVWFACDSFEEAEKAIRKEFMHLYMPTNTETSFMVHSNKVWQLLDGNGELLPYTITYTRVI